MDDSIPQEAGFATSSSLCGLLLPLLSCLVRNPPLLGNSPLMEAAQCSFTPHCWPSIHSWSPATPACFCFQYCVEEELSCPPPGNLPNPGIKSWSPTLQVDSWLSQPPGKLLPPQCNHPLKRSTLLLNVISRLKYVPSCWVSLPTSLLQSFPDFLVTSWYSPCEVRALPLHPRLALILQAFRSHILVSSLSDLHFLSPSRLSF